MLLSLARYRRRGVWPPVTLQTRRLARGREYTWGTAQPIARQWSNPGCAYGLAYQKADEVLSFSIAQMLISPAFARPRDADWLAAYRARPPGLARAGTCCWCWW